ncbi:MAG: DNA repair protein RadA [Acidimicrobiales bacterium]
MARPRTVHICTECGSHAPRWSGRCAGCGAWNTLEEEVVPAGRTAVSTGGLVVPATPVAVTEIALDTGAPVPTGVGELDRVLGGGLVAGSVTLLGGEPGVGKSTLLLQALAALARRGARCLLISAEESPAQVRRRANRIDAAVPGLWLVAETSLPGIRSAVAEVSPDVLVVDSVQTVWDPDLESTPGSVVQVKGCAHQLATMAKGGGPSVLLVGHVTKDGGLAGPRALEHLVDTVLMFEGDRHHALRLLRAVKHRFGATGELGVFEMGGTGLAGVADPSGMFLGDRRADSPGSAVFPCIEGKRPLLVEVQALVVKSPLGTPRRSANGFDSGRLALLLAVLDRHVGLSLTQHDVYVSTVGGVRIGDPGADLAVCAALVSAATGRPVRDDAVIFGEVGLGGEIRRVAQGPRRLAEAARLGFGRAVVPAGGGVVAGGTGGRGLVLCQVGSLVEGIGFALHPVPAPCYQAAAGM